MTKQATIWSVALAFVAFTATAYAAPDSKPDTEARIAQLYAATPATLSEAQWGEFSHTLVDALKSDHDGLQRAALRLVIQHGDKVDVNAAVFDVMSVYRNNQDENTRRMAVVALGQMNSRWAMRFLQRSIDFEKSPAVLQTIKAVVSDYYANAG